MVKNQAGDLEVRGFNPSSGWTFSLESDIVYLIKKYNKILILLEKYRNFFFENLVDFNEADLHEATLNIYTHA